MKKIEDGATPQMAWLRPLAGTNGTKSVNMAANVTKPRREITFHAKGGSQPCVGKGQGLSRWPLRPQRVRERTDTLKNTSIDRQGGCRSAL